MKFDITGRVPANWKLLGILYNDIYYNSSDPVAEFRAAWEKPDFVKLPKAEDGDWAWTGQKGSKFELDHLDPPVQVQSEKRWKVDKDARYVEWMVCFPLL